MKVPALRIFFIAALFIAGCHDRADLFTTEFEMGEGARDRIDLSLPPPIPGEGVEWEELGDDEEGAGLVIGGGIPPPDAGLGIPGAGGFSPPSGEPGAGGAEKAEVPPAEKAVDRMDFAMPDPLCNEPLAMEQVDINPVLASLAGYAPPVEHLFTESGNSVLLDSKIGGTLKVMGGKPPYSWHLISNCEGEDCYAVRDSSTDRWHKFVPKPDKDRFHFYKTLRYNYDDPVPDDFEEKLTVSVVDSCPNAGSRQVTKTIRFKVKRPIDKIKDLWVDLDIDRLSDAGDGSGSTMEVLFLGDSESELARVEYDLGYCDDHDLSACNIPKKVEVISSSGELAITEINKIEVNLTDDFSYEVQPITWDADEIDLHLDKITLFTPFWKANYIDAESGNRFHGDMYDAGNWAIATERHESLDYIDITCDFATTSPNRVGDHVAGCNRGSNTSIWQPLTNPWYSNGAIEEFVDDLSP